MTCVALARRLRLDRASAAVAVAAAALWCGTARGEVRVDTDACPALDGVRLRRQIDVELSATTNAPRPGEMDLNVSCAGATVHIGMPRDRFSRDIPFPDASDPDKERTIAIAAVQTLVTVMPVPPRLPPPSVTVAPGIGLQLSLTFVGTEAGVRGWWPVTKHHALIVAPALGWMHAGAGSAHVVRYQLELSFAYRPNPWGGLPQNELHLFLIPTYSLARDLAPTDPLPPTWSVTPGFGFGVWMHLGRLMVGWFQDVGWSLPKNQWPAGESYDLSHIWLRSSLTFAFERTAGRAPD